MKTYAFHSYKGGSGRTLALANFALALRGSKKKVLMIDFDFDAPGLPYKFNKQNSLKGGYVHYLMGTSISDRAGRQNRAMRIEFLKDILIPIGENLVLLPAGDPGRVAYWQHLASSEFHQLFAFAQDRKTSGGRKVPLAEHENWIAFKNDLEDIAEAAGHPDYCLIDCKAAQEAVAVPVLAWADHIVEFLHCNREGVVGTLLLRKLLQGNELRKSDAPFTPVVCRIPYRTSPAEIKVRIGNLAGDCENSFFSSAKFPIENLQLLVEQRDIEIGDTLVLAEKDRDKYTLAYSYAKLFTSLEPLLGETEKGQLENVLDLNQQDEILERYFRYSFSTGELHNKDNKRNVALRKETIVTLLSSFAEDQDLVLMNRGVDPKKTRDDLIAAAFENAGRRAGQSFGLEAMTVEEVWENGNRPEAVFDRLKQWCSFDREAGFGNWTAFYDRALRKGWVDIGRNHWLTETRDDLGISFLKGYVEGVLSYLMAESDVLTRVRVTKMTATEFEPTEFESTRFKIEYED